MGIGAGIALLALGAVLTFAVNAEVSGISLDVVGIILMVAGAIGLVLGLVARGRSETHVVHDDTVRY